MKIAVFVSAVFALTACAAAPLSDLPPSHPASPAAAEAPSRPMGTDLSDDEPTRVTGQLLAPSSTMTSH